MTATLLRTKLYIPPLRPTLVPRPQLIEWLNQGVEVGHKLTLISAPAGFGKTTLVSDWVAASGPGHGKDGQRNHFLGVVRFRDAPPVCCGSTLMGPIKGK